MTEIYCVKCKKKVDVKDAKKKEFANGKMGMQGKCPKCGTTCTVFVKA